MFKQDSSKYAFLKTFGEYGYGHFYATIYNLTEKRAVKHGLKQSAYFDLKQLKARRDAERDERIVR